MADSPTSAYAIEQELESIYRLYAALATNLDPDSGLGGKLLFVGETDHAATHLLRAANIAGAASLAASADAPALRRVMREGALDFVVTSLDEALRILKNEIRKKLPVAVGVSLDPELILREMLGRGVQPDILPAELSAKEHCAAFIAHGASIVELQPLPAGYAFTILPAPPGRQAAIADFEANLLGTLPPGDHLNRRWLRLAPRYLPSAARRLRSLVCSVPRGKR